MRMRLMEVAFDEKKESGWVGFFGGIIWIWIKCLKAIFLSRRTIVEKSERKAVFLVKLSFWRIFVEAKQFLVRNVERREERFLVVISTSSSSSSPAITLHNSPPALFPHTSPFFLTSFSSSSFCSNFIRGYSEDVSDGIHDGDHD